MVNTIKNIIPIKVPFRLCRTGQSITEAWKWGWIIKIPLSFFKDTFKWPTQKNENAISSLPGPDVHDVLSPSSSKTSLSTSSESSSSLEFSSSLSAMLSQSLSQPSMRLQRSLHLCAVLGTCQGSRDPCRVFLLVRTMCLLTLCVPWEYLSCLVARYTTIYFLPSETAINLSSTALLD